MNMMTLNMPTVDMTTTAQEVVTEQNQPVQKPQADPQVKKRNDEFRARISTCKDYRRKLVTNWSLSIDSRRGKPLASQPDEDSIIVNLDWPLTKAKIASLFSQIPQVRISHPPQSTSAGPWLASLESKLNDTIVSAGIEAAMDECLADCINAAGIGIALVSYEAIMEDKEVPAIDINALPPELQEEFAATGTIGGEPVPTSIVPQPVDRRYVIQRISPADFLWPLDFTGSNFDMAPWLGRSGRVTWAEAVQKFGLTDSDREDVIGDDRQTQDRLTHDLDKDKPQPDQKVGFDEIFYKEFQYDPESKSYSTIHHLVFLNGKDDPVIDEPWKGQRLGEDGSVIGAVKMPVRVLTLTYISDETIPPSDSAIGRPQVNEINTLRTQNVLQMKRNVPVRWADINRLDPTVMQALMKGTWQGIIPVQGDGTRILGEVAKNGHPVENPYFDQIAKRDLSESWSLGPNQLGSGETVETKGESSEIAEGYRTRIGRERAKVASHFVGIAEVLGGMICLFEDPMSFGEGFHPSFSKALGYSILADSTVLVDAKQRLERMNEFLNTYAKSGYVVLEPVLKEIAILSGLDPNTVIKAPEPKPPVEPNISLRFTGTEDMSNPLALAFLLKSGQAPEPELIEKAKQLIQLSVVRPAVEGPMPPGPPVPEGPTDVPPTAPEGVGEANPDLSLLPQISKRADDNTGGGE